ncbi:MAG: cation transporter [Fimbriimonadaceae bacterium]|nr:cation transporter [Fimbriimonadaceae bacterium]
MKITHLQISGMTCNKCVHHVSEALLAIPGVRLAEVDLASGSARVEHDDVDTALLLAAVEEEGYEAKVVP